MLFACLMMMRAIAKELDVCPWAAQLVYMAMTCAFMDGGNLTEEYANLPAICAIYLSIRCFGREEPEDKLFLPAMGMGVCTMAAFMLRANNALPIAALVLVLAVGAADRAAVCSDRSMRGRVCDGHAGGRDSDCAVAGGKGRAS